MSDLLLPFLAGLAMLIVGHLTTLVWNYAFAGYKVALVDAHAEIDSLRGATTTRDGLPSATVEIFGNREICSLVKVYLPKGGCVVRTFTLVRYEDESGISGTGVVARGCEFPTGRCVIEWIIGEVRSMTLFLNVDEVIAIHGHGGKTELIWDE